MFKRKIVSLAGSDKLNGRYDGAEQTKASGHDRGADNTPNSKTKVIDASLIVFGRDDKRKAHASRFGEDNRDAAMKAAYLMGFHTLAVTKPAMKNIAEGLPEGRVFESGKAFVPFVKEGTCLALEGHAKQFPRDVLELSTVTKAELDQLSARSEKETGTVTSGQTETSSNDSLDIDTPSSYPADWQSIKAGDCVLAVDDPDDGWWEAKVIDANTNTGLGSNTIPLLTLNWVAFEGEPNFTRRANQVALFHPAYVPDVEANTYAQIKGKV